MLTRGLCVVLWRTRASVKCSSSCRNFRKVGIGSLRQLRESGERVGVGS